VEGRKSGASPLLRLARTQAEANWRQSSPMAVRRAEASPSSAAPIFSPASCRKLA